MNIETKINEEENDQFESIVGSSPDAKRFRRSVKKLAEIESNLLIIGETGTGKTLAVRYIYQKSLRRDRPFIEIDCASLGKTIDQKILLGTRPVQDRVSTPEIGLIEQANGGILLLDHVGEMSPEYQEVLLRVFQDNKIQSSRSHKTIELDIRVISTTNHNLDSDIEKGKFDRELYSILSALILQVPTLRQRKQDIPEFISLFLNKYCTQYGKEVPVVPAKILELMLQYDWKGNVRELENVIHNLVLLSPEGELLPDFISFKLKKDPLDILDITNLKRTVSEVERFLIKKALDKVGGNQRKAAKLLGIIEPTLRFKIKKYGIPIK